MTTASDSGPVAMYPVAVGPYIYTPATAYSSSDRRGTLSKNGVPVVLQVTEPLLQNFLTVIWRLESDLAGRWGSLSQSPVCSAA